jgi:hypothetical protein
MASQAFNQTPPGNTKIGTNVMVAGIIFQLVSILVFSALFVLVMHRAISTKVEAIHTPRVKFLIATLSFSLALIVVRSVYRTVELLQGWSGFLITTEAYFIALDGATMAAAVGVFNIGNPGFLLEKAKTNHKGIVGEEELQERSEFLDGK